MNKVSTDDMGVVFKDVFETLFKHPIAHQASIVFGISFIFEITVLNACPSTYDSIIFCKGI